MKSLQSDIFIHLLAFVSAIIPDVIPLVNLSPNIDKFQLIENLNDDNCHFPNFINSTMTTIFRNSTANRNLLPISIIGQCIGPNDQRRISDVFNAIHLASLIDCSSRAKKNQSVFPIKQGDCFDIYSKVSTLLDYYDWTKITVLRDDKEFSNNVKENDLLSYMKKLFHCLRKIKL